MRSHHLTARGALAALGQLALLGTLVAGTGRAEVTQESSAPPPATREIAPEALQHRLSVYTYGGGIIYLSNARTLGGGGGGVGLRDTVQDRFIFQADVSYLALLGNVGAVRLGAGIQRSGLYTPALLLMLSTLFGDQFAFLTADHPTAVTRPTFALGVDIAPLRFTTGAAQISVLELGVSVGTELPGLALQYHVNAIEIAARF